MIVDASAVLDLVLRTPRAAQVERIVLDGDPHLQAPAIIDVEVAQVLRRVSLAGGLSPEAADRALEFHLRLVPTVHPERALLRRAWALRHNVTLSDGLYVALAEATEQPLLTTDDRLARAVEVATTARLVDVSRAG